MIVGVAPIDPHMDEKRNHRLTPNELRRLISCVNHINLSEAGSIQTEFATFGSPLEAVPVQVSLILTVIGRDRPGLVEALAQLVSSHGGNWLESRMAHLEGQFAGLLRVRVPQIAVAGLRDALLELDAEGIRILLSESATSALDSANRRVFLELVGQDRPGIVREISAALAVRGINVEDFESRCTNAPMSGETLFHARAELNVPETETLEEVRATLERIGNELMVDVSLEPAG